MSQDFNAPPAGRRALAIPALLMLLAANAVAHSFVLIVLPPLGRKMGLADLQTGMVIGLSALMLTLSGPVWGQICERWGRRPVLLSGLAVAALFPAVLAVILTAALSSALTVGMVFAVLLLARLGQAVGTGGIMPAAQAYLADSTSAGRRAAGMGLMGAAFGAGLVIGGALAWRLGSTQAVPALLAISLLICVGLAVAWRLLPEPPRAPVPAEAARLRVASLWPFLLTTLCGVAVYALVQQVTALRYQDDFGLSLDESIGRSGATLMLTMAVMIVTQGVFVRRLGWQPSRLVRVGAVGGLLAMVVATVAPSIPVLMAAMAGLGAFLGLLLPGNLAALSLRAGAGAQAKVAGLNAIGQGLGMAAGPVMGAALHQLSPAAPYGMAGLLLLVICVLAFRPFAR
ncbi:MFS transporter [Insolitispirillum peregrinum]|uniref:Predicted arabinose efflux permease, MFS family n=1 Tax=Insolitispirillum peregrinum TaxID=80876 RepID=A0A1N7PZH9_9PROT|nr:MFS transporter [Insolitispirillum peregrinum]SIT15945.1 Predicted arabinose efflux permease, MFS family [Insolitispirillum peregrinum]